MRGSKARTLIVARNAAAGTKAMGGWRRIVARAVLLLLLAFPGESLAQSQSDKTGAGPQSEKTGTGAAAGQEELQSGQKNQKQTLKSMEREAKRLRDENARLEVRTIELDEVESSLEQTRQEIDEHGKAQ